MTIFLTTLISIVAIALGTAAGYVWFKCCDWDFQNDIRNYKRLAVVIPITFFFGVVLVERIANMKSAPEPILSPAVVSPQPQKPALKKKTRKKIKKEERVDDESVQLPDETQEVNHD